ncbi:uncharacterized protein LOC115761655 [Drosophila novamexicana]|uniref:uncharacterized protein LOC115761655 n=1 Tax=Drosophila novamexicana TaxID=47314 RepID=UPI0011E5FE19|nr:uncharacterized protein LOC115761655 [Drosophila novamexicana]
MMFCKLRRLELLRSGQLSDCELHVWYMDKFKKSCCRQFQCHKVMLASASEEFERMFEQTETRTRNMLVMNVNDASPDAYETLLLYIYTYEIYNDITIEMCPDLIYLATKYKMPDFVDGYIGKLANQNWPMGTVLKIFQLANEHNRPAMMKLVGKKIVPFANKLLNDNSFLKFSVKELHALMVILKSAGTVSDKELLQSLKKYQVYNNLHYRNMACFQQFVEVTHLFGEPLFEADGTLAISDNDENEIEAAESPEEPFVEEPELPQSLTPKEVAAAAEIQPISGEDKPEDEQLPTSSEDEGRPAPNKFKKSAGSPTAEKRTLQRSPQRASPRNSKRNSIK